jgi:hypothetical protein
MFSAHRTRHTKERRLEDPLLTHSPALYGFGRGHQTAALGHNCFTEYFRCEVEMNTLDDLC